MSIDTSLSAQLYFNDGRHWSYHLLQTSGPSELTMRIKRATGATEQVRWAAETGLLRMVQSNAATRIRLNHEHYPPGSGTHGGVDIGMMNCVVSEPEHLPSVAEASRSVAIGVAVTNSMNNGSSLTGISYRGLGE